jgi:hypothetical protein
MSKDTVVVYHYFEKDKTYRDNLIYFLSNGVHQDADYFIIISGECSVALPEFSNVTYVTAPNRNNDFGGYIKYVQEYFNSSYKYYIFVNSSVRGPFTPSYLTDFWGNIFTSKLDENVKLAGTSINILPRDSWLVKNHSEAFQHDNLFAHVQSTSYALDREAMEFLISVGFYSNDDYLNKIEVILSYELRLSREIIGRGWNITSILPVYEGVDYRIGSVPWENTSAKEGDVMWEQSFYGRSVSPLEAVFIKTNRDMIDEIELSSFTFTGLYGNLSSKNGFEEADALFEESYLTLTRYENQRKRRSLKSKLFPNIRRVLREFFR